VIWLAATVPWWSWPVAFFLVAAIAWAVFWRYRWTVDAEIFAIIGMILLATALGLLAAHWTVPVS
jgi:hypothetical protein